MAKMLLWVDFKSETILERIVEVEQKERELTEAVRKLKRVIEEDAKATPATESAGVEER